VFSAVGAAGEQQATTAATAAATAAEHKVISRKPEVMSCGTQQFCRGAVKPANAAARQHVST
jgi:hypothetical protein